MRTRWLTFVLLVCAAASGGGAAQEHRILATTVVSAPVTLLPDPGRTPLATLPEGTQVHVLGGEQDGWYRVSFRDSYLWGDRIGYIRVEHLRLPVAVTAAEGTPSATTGDTKGSPVANTGASDRAATPPRRTPRRHLPDERIAAAIAAGRRGKPSVAGLRLLDTGESWTELTAATRARYRLQVYTPQAWIQQLASDAAAASRPFGLAEVTDEMTEPVLRITAYTETVNNLRKDLRKGPAGAAPPLVHVTLRPAGRGTAVVQPLSKEPVSQHVLTAMGGRVSYDGLRLMFPLDAVKKLRGPRGDGELVVTLTGATGERKDVRITAQQLARLPM